MGVPTSVNLKAKKVLRKNSSENRKIRKPMMEKRRRERINACLTTLASILLTSETGKSDAIPLASSKKKNRLEKADILEKTVNYWNKLEENNKNKETVNLSDGKQDDHFKLGYESCANMVDSLLKEWETEASVLFREDLNFHLKENLNTLSTEQKVKENPSENVLPDDEETLTFVPEFLPDGSFALIVRSKTVGESVLLKRNSELLNTTSNPNTFKDSNDHSGQEAPRMDSKIENLIFPNEENLIFESEVWRPWF
ncbi:UNVERIFIED_CONTAM: hypothetical protein RMT77_017009 [Armadillidium vulgare]